MEIRDQCYAKYGAQLIAFMLQNLNKNEQDT